VEEMAQEKGSKRAQNIFEDYMDESRQTAIFDGKLIVKR